MAFSVTAISRGTLVCHRQPQRLHRGVEARRDAFVVQRAPAAGDQHAREEPRRRGEDAPSSS